MFVSVCSIGHWELVGNRSAFFEYVVIISKQSAHDPSEDARAKVSALQMYWQARPGRPTKHTLIEAEIA